MSTRPAQRDELPVGPKYTLLLSLLSAVAPEARPYVIAAFRQMIATSRRSLRHPRKPKSG
jgi:hypothetical protein